MPHFLNPFSGEWKMGALTLSGSYTDSEATLNDIFDAWTLSLSASINQLVKQRTSMTLGYGLTDNQNKNKQGHDYAYTSHSFNVRLDKGFGVGYAAFLTYTMTMFDYHNPDTFSNFKQYRESLRHTIGIGGSYRFKRNISFRANLSHTRNDSNLPVGRVLTIEDFESGLINQSTSIGDYKTTALTVGVSVSL